MAELGDERRIAPNPFGPAGTRVIVAPFQFYVDGADHLRIEAWNSATGAAIEVRGRFFNEQGDIDVFSHRLPLSADRARTVLDVGLSKGFLVNLVAQVSGASPKIGQTFVRCSVIRGLTGATVVLGVLLQGYVTANQVVAWPGSPIQNCFDVEGFYRTEFSIPDLGTGVQVTCPTGAHWSLVSVGVSLATSAVAGNRRPYLVFANTAGYLAAISATVIAASSTGRFYWGPAMSGNVGALAGPVVTTPLPTNPELVAGDYFQLLAENVDAGDTFRILAYKVRERLEVG